jgi:cardiolipin synthase A/B
MGMPPVRRAFFILFIAGLVVALLLLLAQDQVTLKLRSAVGAAEPPHQNYIAGLLGVQLTRGNRYVVLTNGDQIFPAMLNAIRNAKRRVSFETYIYKTGKMAEEFTKAFEEAARRGVRVSLVLDAVGSGIDDEHVRRLESAGCRVARFNTPAWYSLEELNYSTHRKILVVDGQTAFTGGAGIDDQWMGNAQSKEHWRDTMVQIDGPLARLMEGGFYENLAEAAGEITPELDDATPETDPEGGAFVVRSSPSGGANDLKRLYLLALASARQTIVITTPYFVTDESSRWSLEDARRRGIRIRLLVEGDITDAMPVKYASRKHYEQLLEQGIEIYEYQPTMMHAKTTIVDGTWSIIGSANFDNRSLDMNDEINVGIADPILAQHLLETFEDDLARAKRLTLDLWRARPLHEKTNEKFWSLLREFF